MARTTAAAAVGYVLGTFPSADLAARAAHHTADLRSEGSGNPGAANVANVIGRQWGASVMMVDVAKGVAAGRIGAGLAAGAGANAAATAAVVGHCYPVWNGFHGGKGVATSVGQVLATFPAYFPIDFMVGFAGVSNPRFRHRTFVANTIASIAWVGAATLWWRRRLPNLWGPEPTIALPLGALTSSLVIYGRFRSSLGAEQS